MGELERRVRPLVFSNLAAWGALALACLGGLPRAEGDEVGGLIFNGMKKGEGHSALGHLSFDQWQQNQVVACRLTAHRRSSSEDREQNERAGTPHGRHLLALTEPTSA